MFKFPNRTPAMVFLIAVVLISNPELLALIFTIQAISVEVFILLLTLQCRSVADDIFGLFNFLFMRLKVIAAAVHQLVRLFFHLVPYLILNPKQLVVVRQLELLMRLCIGSFLQLLFLKRV